jgi:pyruvate formate lyase activating enzyme
VRKPDLADRVDMSTSGIIISIQRFSIHDGPGIRTTVFFKGCSLRCFWCHNPESIRPVQEIQFYPDRCIGCQECAAICGQQAHHFGDEGHTYDRAACIVCGQCVGICCAAAVELAGRRVTTDEVMAEVLADRAVYATSGGGVTLSGGEPVLQREFAQAILERSKYESLHTALETAGNCRWDDLAALLPLTDLVMMDIKHMDPVRHKQATGVTNERILANARRVAASGRPVIFRIPVVPTVNDCADAVEAVAEFVAALGQLGAAEQCRLHGVPQLELLPFHRLAGDKYRSLGLDYRAAGLEPPNKAHMAELTAAAARHNLTIRCR